MNRFQHAQIFVLFLFLSQQYFNMPEMLIDSDGIYFQSIVLEF